MRKHNRAAAPSLLLVLLALLAVAVPASAAAAQQADIVFILDESGSMRDEIADIRQNITGVASAVSGQLDARYALVSFAATPPDGPAIEPFVRTDFTDAAGLTRALEGSRASSPAGQPEMGVYATAFAFNTLTGFRPRAGACGILVSDEAPSWKTNRETDMRQALVALDNRHATWFGIVNLNSPMTRRHYGPEPGSLAVLNGGAVFSIEDFRRDPSVLLQSVLSRCGRAVVEASRCTVTGTGRNDVLRGTPGRDVICALGGNDVVHARGGRDLVYGGRGNDRLAGGLGRDVLLGERGHDRLLGGAGPDRLFGGLGRDRFVGGAGSDTIRARDGRRDMIFGGPGIEVARVDRFDRLFGVERARRR